MRVLHMVDYVGVCNALACLSPGRPALSGERRLARKGLPYSNKGENGRGGGAASASGTTRTKQNTFRAHLLQVRVLLRHRFVRAAVVHRWPKTSCIAGPKRQTAELQQHPSFTLLVCRTTNSHSRVLLSICKSLLCTRLTLPPATAPITASRCTCREEKGWWVSNKNAISTFHQKAMQV